MFKLDPEIQQKLDAAATKTVAVESETVDRDGVFPKASMDALAAAGLLGLISAREIGGLGQGPGAAALAVLRIARECGSTGMVLTMHYAGAAVIEKYGAEGTRRDVAAGRHLSTLAFSEAGSRSHFWAPISTATADGGGVRLNARQELDHLRRSRHGLRVVEPARRGARAPARCGSSPRRRPASPRRAHTTGWDFAATTRVR